MSERLYPEDDPRLQTSEPAPTPPAPKGEDARVEEALGNLYAPPYEACSCVPCRSYLEGPAETRNCRVLGALVESVAAPLRKEIEELRADRQVVCTKCGYVATSMSCHDRIADLKAQVERHREKA